MVTFNQPLYLVLALCLVPGFLLVGRVVDRFQKTAIARFGRWQTLSRFSKFSKKTTTAVAITLSLVFLTLAAAEPVLSSSENGTTRRTLNAILLVDVSRSMLAEDGPGGASRLEAGILAIEKLFEAYPDGRFGLVIYTDEVTVYPPTFDHTALSFILRDVLENYSSAVRGEGSDPITALNEAGKLIKELPYTVDAVFLISDGGKSLSPIDIHPPLAPVLKKLKGLGVHLVVIGVGGLIPAAIPVYADDGVLIGYHQYQGVVVYTALSEISLKSFADGTSGRYLRLTDTNDLVAIARSENLDSQPIAQESTTSLVWLPVTISILLTALWLRPRIS